MANEPTSNEEGRDYTPNPIAPTDRVLSTFFNAIVDSDSDTQSGVAKDIAPFYLDTRPFSERVDPLITALNERVVPYEKASRKVKLARQFLQGLATAMAPGLHETQTAMFLYGSAVFDDPRNFDPDIIFLTRKKTDLNKELSNVLGEALGGRTWEEIAGKDTGEHVSLRSVEDLEELQNAFVMQDLGFIKKYGDTIQDHGIFSVCFTGLPLYTPSPEFVPELQRDIRGYAERNPLVAGGIHRYLKDTLDIREQRAAGRK